MAVRRVTPQEAQALMQKEGYAYLDVRSIPEFEAGHPAGAFNVPIAHLGPSGMGANPDFMAVVESAFAKDAKLVVGCKAGPRSMHATALMAAAGYTSLADQYCGYDGGPGGPGWRPAGLPVEVEAAPERTYEHLKKGRP